MEVGVAIPNIGPMATGENVLALAERADEVGLDSVWVGDHLAFPRNPKLPYPYSRGAPRYLPSNVPILEPITLMAAIVARTSRVRVGVSVLILPYRHPLVTAKMIATIDAISSGRVILGVGVGWLPEEFEAVNADLETRGAVTDEQIRYFREVWSNDEPSFDGRFYQLSGIDVFPKPVDRSIPIWIGGQSPAAMRRAANLGDGLHLIDLTLAELEGVVERFAKICAQAQRPPEEVTLSIRSTFKLTDGPATPEEQKTPITGNVEQVVGVLREFERLGIRHVCLGPRVAQNVESFLGAIDVIGKEIKPALA